MPGGPVQVVLIYDFGNETSKLVASDIEKKFRQASPSNIPLSKFKHSDFRQPVTHSDINIHIGQPFYSYIDWGFVNCLFKGEGWNEEVHSPYVSSFDEILDIENLNVSTSRCMSLVSERRPVKGNYHCPPVLLPEDCPPISIITPTYNRREFIDIAFHNLMATDYPQEKIEWIVVEDCDSTADSTKMASDKIMSFQVNCPKITIKYIPLSSKVPVGEKRNIGVEKSSNDIILFMDDDDHYPVTSFRRRVAWLLKGPRASKTSIACCTSIALYDLMRGVSAVNMPPMNLTLSQRISEATLTFKKSAWIERKFSDVTVSEGEAWIKGREDQVVEMMPQQIIVAFSHNKNLSGRRVPPADATVGCFWGFPKEYLIFIHKLAGVVVEEDISVSSNSGKLKRA